MDEPTLDELEEYEPEFVKWLEQEVKELRAIVRSANGQLESSYAPLQSFVSISSNAKRLAVLRRALEDSE